MMKLLKSRHASAEYIGTAVSVLVVVFLIALVINVFSIINVKEKLDVCADQMVRQIQLSGEVNAGTQSLFDRITAECGGITAPRYTVDASYFSGKKIQFGTPFYVTVSAQVTLGGFGKLLPFPLTITAKAAGVSEGYWK